MTTRRTFSSPPTRTTADSEGSKTRKIGPVYPDEQTGLPLWITAATGMFATSQNFAAAAVTADGRNVLIEGR
jgi:hypothetical protein